ncbi:hypothetical protein Bbelb_042960 [Branchiostoma belcheri]|nr:hypothetical protein Bbelb_042960 [Branchiostoma belcheri]
MLRLCDRLVVADRVYREGDNFNAELTYAGALKGAMEGGDNLKELEIAALKSMGDVYLDRGTVSRNGSDFTKASALYNSALVRCQDPDNSQTLLHRIKRTEKVFLEKVGGVKGAVPSTVESDLTHKSQLQDIRSECDTRLQEIKKLCSYDQGDRESEETLAAEGRRAAAVRRLYHDTTIKIKQFISDLLQECFDLFGDPPCPYAVIGLGSMAREEMTPFSDFEFAILVDCESKEEKSNARYFRVVTNLLHLKILNLQETILPAMAIRSLNNFVSGDPANNWFYDSVMPQGFAFDGAMPWACKTPIGRGPYKNKPALEYIRTPAGMAELQKEEEDHVADVLRKVCLITGDQRMVNQYERLVNQYLDSPSHVQGLAVRTERALRTLCTDMETFNIHRIPRRAEPFNVKKFVYRLSSLVVDSLGLLVGSDEKTAAAILSEMTNQTIIHKVNGHHLQVAAAIADETRMRTYIANGGQKELASFWPTSPAHDYVGAPIFRDIESGAMHRFFKTTFALQYFLTTSVDQERFKEFETIHRPGTAHLTKEQALSVVSNLFHKLRKLELYVDKPSMQALVHGILQENAEAENCYRVAMAQPDDTMSKCRIALDFAGTLLLNGKRSEAIDVLRDTASTLVACLKTSSPEASDVRSVRKELFRAWRKLIEVNSTTGDVAAVNDALKAYDELSPVLSQHSDSGDNCSVHLLCEIAQHYCRIGKHDLGRKYLLLAKTDADRMTEMAAGRESSSLARCKFTIGFTSLQLEEQRTAMLFLKGSLEAYSRLYGSDSQATEITAAKLALARAYREQAMPGKSQSTLKKLFSWFKATPYFTDIEWWWKVLDPQEADASSLADSLEEMKLEIEDGVPELTPWPWRGLSACTRGYSTSSNVTTTWTCSWRRHFRSLRRFDSQARSTLRSVCVAKLNHHIGLLYRLSILQRGIGDKKAALGTAFLGLAQLKDRRERTAIEHGREDAGLLSMVGEVFASLNEIQEAINVWEVELQIRTYLKETGVQVGLLHYQLGFSYQVFDTKRAIEHLEKGLDVLNKISLSTAFQDDHVLNIDDRAEAKSRVHVPDLIARSNELLNKLRPQSGEKFVNV